MNLEQTEDNKTHSIAVDIPIMMLDEVVSPGEDHEFGVVVTMGTKQELVWVGIYTIKADSSRSTPEVRKAKASCGQRFPLPHCM